jgi:PKD repeat protein
LVLTVAVAGALSLLGAACDELVTETIEITTAGNPTAEFTFSPDSGCTPLAVSFDASLSTGPITRMIFNFGDSSYDTLNIAAGEDDSLVHIYTEPGSYRVVLTVFDNIDGSDAEAKARAVIAGHNIDSVTLSDTLVCPGVPIDFQAINPAGIVTWRWEFGDGQVSTDSSVVQTHAYANPGVYQFKLIVTGDCGSTTLLDTVHVLHCPEESFTFDPTFGCVPLTVTFTSPPAEIMENDSTQVGTIVEWLWSFGTSTFGSDPVEVVTYASAGDYEITLTVTTDSGGVKVFTDSLTVWPNLVGFTAAPISACEAAGYQYVVAFRRETAGDTAWLWDFGDGDSSVLQNPYHAYTEPGYYSVSLTAWGACGTDSTVFAEVNLITYQDILDNAGFTGTTVIGTDTAIVFEDTTTAAIIGSWRWEYGDGDQDSGTNLGQVTHEYERPTVLTDYEVIMTIFNDCDSAKVVDTIQIPTP